MGGEALGFREKGKSMKKQDRRVVRTLGLLQEAMLTLLQQKAFTAITVQDITEAANLNRATFYLHYQDKESLLIDSLNVHFDQLVEEIDREMDGQSILESSLPERHVFYHVAAHRELYEVLLSPTGPGFVMQRMIDYIASFGVNRMRAQFPENQEIEAVLPLISQHVAGGLFALLRWWMQQGMPKTPEDMAEIVHALANVGVVGFLQSQHRDLFPTIA